MEKRIVKRKRTIHDRIKQHHELPKLPPDILAEIATCANLPIHVLTQSFVGNRFWFYHVLPRIPTLTVTRTKDLDVSSFRKTFGNNNASNRCSVKNVQILSLFYNRRNDEDDGDDKLYKAFSTESANRIVPFVSQFSPLLQKLVLGGGNHNNSCERPVYLEECTYPAEGNRRRCYQTMVSSICGAFTNQLIPRNIELQGIDIRCNNPDSVRMRVVPIERQQRLQRLRRLRQERQLGRAVVASNADDVSGINCRFCSDVLKNMPLKNLMSPNLRLCCTAREKLQIIKDCRPDGEAYLQSQNIWKDLLQFVACPWKICDDNTENDLLYEALDFSLPQLQQMRILINEWGYCPDLNDPEIIDPLREELLDHPLITQRAKVMLETYVGYKLREGVDCAVVDDQYSAF